MKFTKKTIQIIILIIVVLAIGFYFLNEFYLSKEKQPENQITLENIFEFKVVRQDLSAESVEKYKQRFIANKEKILGSQEKFDFSAINSMAMTKNILHDFEGARDAWLYLSAKSPKNSLSFFNLAILYMEDLKDNQKAEEYFKIVLENSKNDANNAQYYRTILDFYTYYYPEKKTEAEKVLLDALKRENKQDEFEILILLATYYQSNEQNNKALEYWQKALVLDPGNEGIKMEIDRLK